VVSLPDIITNNQLSTWLPRLTGFEHNILRRRSMKLVKNLVFAVVLASVLAISAPAGELNTPGFAAPTPTPAPESATIIPDDGVVIYDPNPESTETSDYLFFEALAALLSMY
jgi:hypothetical protein